MLNYHRHGNIHVDTNKTEKGDEKNVKRLHEHERKRQRERRRHWKGRGLGDREWGGHAQLQLKREWGCTRIWAISLKLCLPEQLSWQMTLLHMDKRGLQATLHVSFSPGPNTESCRVNIGCARALTCLDLQGPWRKWIQICSVHVTPASSFVFAYTPVQSVSLCSEKTAVLTVMRWGIAVANA